ncbi:Bin/amphiphysin/Rvs domain for vesicular trafficking-domain-containing protein [Phellopilus nigrolimitatus]|nr:Bin/amphiphysin/Rvs domain for vesicular trafficking-domain-containing protein [Phellopilus nigrolimitatus]
MRVRRARRACRHRSAPYGPPRKLSNVQWARMRLLCLFLYFSATWCSRRLLNDEEIQLLLTMPHGFTNFAATNLKGTMRPPHRSPCSTRHSRKRSEVQRRHNRVGQIADARLTQDSTIRTHFLQPRQATLTNSIAVALKVRQAVSASWLELDTAKEVFETAGRARQEQSRLEVENAEDDLVQTTEVAITLMKTVLESSEPLETLNELVKAQLAYTRPL